ncbi:hypothetical protein BGZ58_002762 [Dissophora ornata]|nr:hypothetical protein BGZ58_002762 [Dissophora ornata]
MSKTESMLVDLATNGRSDSYPTLKSSSSQQIQMDQLQAPQFNEKTFDLDAQPAPAEDLFGSIEPHLRRGNTKAAQTTTLSKL